MVMKSSVQMLDAKVMHHRVKPQKNAFTYGLNYFQFPIGLMNKRQGGVLFGINRAALFSFQAVDHAHRDGGDAKIWVSDILAYASVTDADLYNVRLITLPRVMGYVFNPVSFWMCPNAEGGLRAVICEVNNTFGETHIYVCTHEDGKEILSSDVMEAKKLFHVSPFLKVEGKYKFRFSCKDNFFAAFIDYFDGKGDITLLTAVSGKMSDVTNGKLIKAFFRYPLMTLRVTYLIHWQALKIFINGIRYIPKPSQLLEKISISSRDI